jgi:two-component SAPR family response regulator
MQTLKRPYHASGIGLFHCFTSLICEETQSIEKRGQMCYNGRQRKIANVKLATALWHIRRCLPADYILSDPHMVQFDPQVDLWLDVDEFESRVSHGDVASLQSAVALCRGDFLDGFYDDWIINERYRLGGAPVRGRLV